MAEFVMTPHAVPTLPVAGGGLFPVRRIYCVGRNYADHAREMGGNPEREAPFFFNKPADAVTQAATVAFPPATRQLEFEGELVVAIGLGGADIPVGCALSHVFGYTVGCDLTRRDLQAAAKKEGRPWDMAKGFDQSAAAGIIQPVGKTGHPHKGTLRLTVNGIEKQNGDLSAMIWSVAEIIAAISALVTLAPGDLIYTGTPAGVGGLQRGDAVEISVEGVTAHTFTLV